MNKKFLTAITTAAVMAVATPAMASDDYTELLGFSLTTEGGIQNTTIADFTGDDGVNNVIIDGYTTTTSAIDDLKSDLCFDCLHKTITGESSSGTTSNVEGAVIGTTPGELTTLLNASDISAFSALEVGDSNLIINADATNLGVITGTFIGDTGGVVLTQDAATGAFTDIKYSSPCGTLNCADGELSASVYATETLKGTVATFSNTPGSTAAAILEMDSASAVDISAILKRD